jgi:hypothetical protein
MLSLALGGLAAGCSSSTNGTTTTTTGAATTTTGGVSTSTGGASTTTTGGASTTSTGGASTTTTGGVGTTTGGASTTTGGASTTTTGGTSGGSLTTVLSDAGCFITLGGNCPAFPTGCPVTRDPNATNDEIKNGCTSAQGVSLGTSTLPCWDGGVTGTSNLPTDFYNSGFLPGPSNNITCPTM